MKVISIQNNDATNSVTGFTFSIFFSGCDHHCEGCFSPKTWDYDNGTDYTVDDLFNLINSSRHKNVSLIGGDPFFIKNRDEVVELIKRIKGETNKNVYVWTGYLISDVEMWIDPAIIDYLIDGRFELSKRDIRLTLRGSSNQNIYYKGEKVEI